MRPRMRDSGTALVGSCPRSGLVAGIVGIGSVLLWLSWIGRRRGTMSPGWLSGPRRSRSWAAADRPQAVRGHGAACQAAPGEHD